jgi:hypothetical protein
VIKNQEGINNVMLSTLSNSPIKGRKFNDVDKATRCLINRNLGLDLADEFANYAEDYRLAAYKNISSMFKRSHELEDEIRKRLEAIGYDI